MINKYAYAFNNPLKYTDPSGWWPQDPGENYDEPHGVAPGPGGEPVYVLDSWYDGPDPVTGMMWDFEGRLSKAIFRTSTYRPPEAGKTFEDYYFLGADGKYHRRDWLAYEWANAERHYGQEAYNWLAKSGYDQVSIHAICGMSMTQDEFNSQNQTNLITINGTTAPWSNETIEQKIEEILKIVDGANQSVGYGVSLAGLAIEDIKFLSQVGNFAFFAGLGIAALRTDWQSTQSITEFGIGTGLSTWAYFVPWAIPFAGAYSVLLIDKEYSKTLPKRAATGFKSSSQQIRNHPYFKNLDW